MTIPMHSSLVKLSLINTTIFPLILAIAMPFSILKVSFIGCVILIYFLTFTMWLTVNPIARIHHSIVFIVENSITIKIGFFEASFIIRPIKIYENSMVCFCLPVHKISNVGLSLLEVADSVAIRNVLFEGSFVSDS